MTGHDIDALVLAHLAGLVAEDDAPETIPEIAGRLQVSEGRVRFAVKRLVGSGQVRSVGVAAGGGKTWTLATDSRVLGEAL